MSSSGLRGQPYLLTFLYTDCEDGCPLIGQDIRQAFERLGRHADHVAAVAVSAAPKATPGMQVLGRVPVPPRDIAHDLRLLLDEA